MSKFDEAVSQQLGQSQQAAAAAAQAAAAPPAEPQKLRTAAQGLFLGWADELEAGVRAMVFEDRPYEEIRDEIRQKVTAYQEQNPGEALTMEALGAIAPTAAAFLVPGGQPAAAANVARVTSGIGSLAKRGFAEGAVTAAGQSEADTGMGVALDATTGGVTGAVISPVMGAVGSKVVGKASDVMNWLRTNVGERPSNAAMAELQRLAAGTGKTVDEIVQDIADGKILAENRTLAAAVRAIKSKGAEEAGTAPSTIDTTLRQRARETSERAGEAAESALMPGARSSNVFQSIKASDDALKAAERRGYSDVFGANPEVDTSIAMSLEELAKRFPKLADELNQGYLENNLVPLFTKGDNKALVMNRIPTLEDAEVFYRLMRDEGNARWMAGKGQTAQPLTDAMGIFKQQLDTTYPALAAVRRDAAARLGARDAFDAGRKAFGRDVDELQFEFEALNPEAKEAFRAGVLAAWKNKTRRSPTAVARGADVTRQEGAVLKAVLGENFETMLQKELEIAGESAEAVNRILYGSMTAPQAAAERAVGSGQIGMADILAAYSLDPMAMTAVIGKVLAKKAPGLKPADYEKITEVLLSDDPDFVARMLNDKVSLGDATRVIEGVLATGAEASRRAATVTGSGRASQTVSPGMQGILDIATQGMAP